MNDEWVPCSDGARARQDSLVATGSLGERWFLVETQAGWGRHALLEPPFDPALGRALVRRIEGAGHRGDLAPEELGEGHGGAQGGPRVLMGVEEA